MSTFLKIATGISNLAIFAHAVVGFQDLFPALDALPPSPMRAAAKIRWMEGSGWFVLSDTLPLYLLLLSIQKRKTRPSAQGGLSGPSGN